VKTGAIIVGLIILIIGLYAWVGWLFHFLWNELIPKVFEGPHITWVQGLLFVFFIGMIGRLLRGFNYSDLKKKKNEG
jgi:hypothetical protein